MIIKSLKRGLNILLDPKKGFSNANKCNFELAVGHYMWLLITVAIAAGVINLLFSIGKAIYFDLFVNAEIQYIRMANYSFSSAFSLFFFYLFAGTLLTFILSLFLRPFFNKIKYTDFLKIIFFSLTPLLLFAWLPFNPVPFVIWSLFLFIYAIRSYKSIEIKRDSIQQRD